MRKRTGWILGVALVGSLLGNAFLLDRVSKWQEAWTEQSLTTSVVERLYKQSGADTSYKSVRNVVARELGEYEETSAREAGLDWPGPSARVIVIDGTKLIFDNGQYAGSKADLPAGLEHWRGNDPW
ncbi:hypothetical protein C8D92_105189 [Tamilnaduibacter salinus]|uniref:Uncharacterized protein n=1 Tax=Tamilnaduibacter salinus TaxID=1484056 RepID=A0A2U1CWV7_9GAMM|nr:hypothetical protein [Tamilnaduibacter salinus]PVY76436.1 hypothetical protein C8D92_105189 [Tamilnaduibacter salinus]